MSTPCTNRLHGCGQAPASGRDHQRSSAANGAGHWRCCYIGLREDLSRQVAGEGNSSASLYYKTVDVLRRATTCGGESAGSGPEQWLELPLIVVEESPSLFRRDWLSKLTLDWKKIHSIQGTSLASVLERHSRVFEEGSTLRGYEVHLHVDPTVRPKFCKAVSIQCEQKWIGNWID